MKQIPLGTGAEFDIIRSILAQLQDSPTAPHVRVGPGDDCAVVTGDGIALSMDMSVEGVHFRRDWLELEEIGYRATAAALSDLAAVAAKPIGIMVALALPPAKPETTASRIMSGALQAAARVNAILLGGDVTRTNGPLVIDVVVIGNTTQPVLRAGAQAGDELWLTGNVGGAAGAVRALLHGMSLAPDARRAFAHPVPRVAEALWLAQHGVLHAMIDVSDGLAGDLGHIVAASNVSATIDAALVPVHASVAAVTRDRDDGLLLALAGGEDYELCFAAAPGTVDSLLPKFRAEFDCALTRIGSVEQGTGVWLRGFTGQVAELVIGGFDHFAEHNR